MELAKRFAVLIASWMVAIVPWGESLGSWDAALTTNNFFPFIGITGGVLLAWLGKSPRKV